jgi:hypothetical protein
MLLHDLEVSEGGKRDLATEGKSSKLGVGYFEQQWSTLCYMTVHSQEWLQKATSIWVPMAHRVSDSSRYPVYINMVQKQQRHQPGLQRAGWDEVALLSPLCKWWSKSSLLLLALCYSGSWTSVNAEKWGPQKCLFELPASLSRWEFEVKFNLIFRKLRNTIIIHT